MLNYEILDTLADSYVPILAVLSLTAIAITAITGHPRFFGIQLASLCSGLLVAYGLMFADNRLGLWHGLGLDYSTHTAVALVLVIFLSITMKKHLILWFSSLSAYVLLMLYQEYNSVADMITTALAIGLLLLPGIFLFYRNSRHYD